MYHHFSVEVATLYGVDLAVFLDNLVFWTDKNLANKEHFKDGRIWVYNTQEAWTILFPYFSRQNIRTIVTKALAADLVIKGNYNKLNYDRTTWYSVSDKGLELFPLLRDKIIKLTPTVDNYQTLGWNQPMERLESTNTLVGINQPIPDNKPNNKQQIKSFCQNEQKKHKAVDKQDWKEANQTKHSWAEAKEPPRADVTKQSTSYDPSKHNVSPRLDPNAPGYQAFLNANPAIKRAHERRKKNDTKANELSTRTAVQPEVSQPEHPSKKSSEHALDGQSYLAPSLRSGNTVMAPRRTRSYSQKARVACTDRINGDGGFG